MKNISDDVLRDLGAKIKALRVRRGLTQGQLADLIKIRDGHGYISKIENGKMNITIKNLVELVTVLQADIFLFINPKKTPDIQTPAAEKKPAKKNNLQPRKIRFLGK